MPRYASPCGAVRHTTVTPSPRLEWLERAILNHGYSGVEYTLRLLNDEAFAPLRSHPRFRQLQPPVLASCISREAGWRADIDHLVAQIARFNPQWRQPPIRDAIAEAAARLHARVPELSDTLVAVEFRACPRR